MADRGTPPVLRKGPGVFAWLCLALFVAVAAVFVYAWVDGAYGAIIVTFFAGLLLSVPTLILVVAEIEARSDNRAALKEFQARP
jgi:hypothetical protein